MPPLPDRTALSTRIVELLSKELKLPADEIKLDAPLTWYGLDSIAALTISGELEDELGLELASTLLWDLPTISKLVDYLFETLTARDLVASPA
ncbi:MAG: acyl carrier protein [Pseudomonadota bacterium]